MVGCIQFLDRLLAWICQNIFRVASNYTVSHKKRASLFSIVHVSLSFPKRFLTNFVQYTNVDA